MLHRDLDTNSAGRYAWAAMQNAKARSYAASTHYSDAEKLTVERVKLMLELAYNSTVYVNYRKKFAAVKVAGNRIQDKNLLKTLEADYEERGYSKLVSPQGVIYRIPRV